MSSPYLPAPPLLSYPIPIDPSLQSVGSSLGKLGRQQFHGRQLAEEYLPSPSLAMSPILSTLPEAFASNAADCVTGSALYDVSPSVPGASNELIPEVQLPPMSTISIPFTSTVLAPMSIRYLFPNPQPPPPPPTKPYLMQANGKAKKSEICQEFVAVETYTQKLLHDVTVLAKENQIMKEYLGNYKLYFDACLRALEENIDMRVKMAVAVKVMTENKKGEGAEPEDDDSDEDELEDDEVEKKKEVKREGLTSHAASNSNLIKALITIMFKLFLGVHSLTTKENLLGASVPNGDKLPLIPGMDVHQIRFDWENTAKKSGNGAKLETIAKFAKTHGHDYKSRVKELLDIIQLGDLKSRVETKFNSLRGIYRRALTEDINMKKESSGTKANWAKGSDDEKDPAEPRKFISRAATWRSRELQEFFDAIDTQPDPKGSSQYIPQVRGQVKEMPLPATKC
ncbi:hypothetical protein EV368DRAFT_89546 [Lentinula lateritia]|nr:hypothetical protein EV368DRAFT_89546 [Lentinula lateritia]